MSSLKTCYRNPIPLPEGIKHLVLGTSEYSAAQKMLHHNAGQGSSASTQHLGSEPEGHVAHQAHRLAARVPCPGTYCYHEGL